MNYNMLKVIFKLILKKIKIQINFISLKKIIKK